MFDQHRIRDPICLSILSRSKLRQRFRSPQHELSYMIFQHGIVERYCSWNSEIKHLGQCLAHNKYSINDECQYYKSPLKLFQSPQDILHLQPLCSISLILSKHVWFFRPLSRTFIFVKLHFVKIKLSYHCSLLKISLNHDSVRNSMQSPSLIPVTAACDELSTISSAKSQIKNVNCSTFKGRSIYAAHHPM